jgi:3-hydroxyisobutyrate dehydrogenase-like beta-hydroxyacid dehydrogenase
MTIAWLGTGLLGSGFVEALLEKGEEVTVWNRSAAKAEPLVAKGATLAKSPADAVRGAERVHLCLSDDAAVDAVIEAFLPALAPGAPIFDHTTVSPAGARRRQKSLTERGVAFLSCPVFMAPQSARTRTGFMLVSAAPALVERWAPTLSSMTGELLRYGDDAGHASTIKLVGNAMIISITAGLADVLAMAKAQGVPSEDAIGLFQKFPVGNVVSGRGKKMSAGDYTATFELTMARKDVSLMIGASDGAALAVLPALLARADALIAKGHGQRDLAAYSVETIPPR